MLLVETTFTVCRPCWEMPTHPPSPHPFFIIFFQMCSHKFYMKPAQKPSFTSLTTGHMYHFYPAPAAVVGAHGRDAAMALVPPAPAVFCGGWLEVSLC